MTDRAVIEETSASVLDINTLFTGLVEIVLEVVVVLINVVEVVVVTVVVVTVVVVVVVVVIAVVSQLFQLFSGVAERSNNQGGLGWRLVLLVEALLLAGGGVEQV